MARPMLRHRASLAALFALSLLAACSKENATQAQADGNAPAVAETRTLAEMVSNRQDLSTFGMGLRETGLGTVFDGTASYTVLAPTNDGFGKLGEDGKILLQTEHRAVLAAVLRSHVLPGFFTPKDIVAAINAHGGQPVEMRSMGNQTLRFAREGDKLTVTSEDGSKGVIGEEPVLAGNGVALPVDTVLKPLPSAATTPSATAPGD